MRPSPSMNFIALTLLVMTPTFQSYAWDTHGTVSSASECLKRRGVLDIGSGQTKLKVFDMNVCAQTAKQVYPNPKDKQEICESRSNLPFKKDLDESIADAKRKAASGQSIKWKLIPFFSRDLIYNGVDAADPCVKGSTKNINVKDELTRFNSKAKSLGVDEVIGVATQAFRESTNSDEIIDFIARQLGMHILVPTGAQEAYIEWMSATTWIKSNPENSAVNADKIATIGFGSGSGQIGVKAADGSFIAFTTTLASDNIFRYAVESVKGTENLLPMSSQDIQSIVAFAAKEANTASDKVKDRLSGGFDSNIKVVAMGGVINKALREALKSMNINRNFFNVEDVAAALDHFKDQNADSPVFADIDANFRQQLIPNVALVKGMMDNLGLTRIYFTTDVDNTLGALFTKEFGIKMKYVPPAESEAVAAARENRKQKVVLSRPAESNEGQTVALSTPTTSDDDESDATCASAGKNALRDGHNCTITNPCMPQTNACSNHVELERLQGHLGGKQCIIRGKTTLIYNMCPSS